jgi:hypothetical protein
MPVDSLAAGSMAKRQRHLHSESSVGISFVNENEVKRYDKRLGE